MKGIRLTVLACIFALTCSCSGNLSNYTGEIPNLEFTHVTKDESGKSCYYLFDDNPEHLNPEFLADGETPSSIAHFDELKTGVYTVFSYHHRGDAAESEQDLFFDVLFRGGSEAEYRITKIGLDHDWQWNKVWADFSGTDVFLPEYLKTSACICKNCSCSKADGTCENEKCGCIVKNELVQADSDRFSGLNKVIKGNQLLSEVIPNIGTERINEIRHGSYNEPIWLMMEFEILAGELSVDTIAYKNKDIAKSNFEIMKKGKVAYEPQFKGIAESAPVVKAELSYTFDNSAKAGPLPVRIFNQKYPNGYVARDGVFATNVNTWKDSKFIKAESAESDMMRLTYRDEEKLSLYGSSVTEKTDIWHFDPFYTSLYSDNGNDTFVPNIPMSQVDYPKGNERTPAKFYSRYVCNLGNFGVRYLYTINLKNHSGSEKNFNFSINSVSGQLYRYSLYKDAEIVCDDGGRYIMKKFDKEPVKEKPQKYTTTESFSLKPHTDYVLKFEVVTLTGCDAPMTNMFSVAD